jgi:hypothetical protein
MHTRRKFVAVTLASMPMLAQNQKDSAECDSLRALVAAPITTDSKTIRIDLQSETFDASDVYRLAIADLIRDHFPRWIIVDPDAKPKLRLTGSNLNGDAQVVEIEFGWTAYQLVRRGLNPVVVSGFFKYKSKGGLIVGDRNERIGMVREAAYGLLSEFQKDDWPKLVG